MKKEKQKDEIRRIDHRGPQRGVGAYRAGKTIDKLFVLDGCQDGPVRTIVREAKRHATPS